MSKIYRHINNEMCNQLSNWHAISMSKSLVAVAPFYYIDAKNAFGVDFSKDSTRISFIPPEV